MATVLCGCPLFSSLHLSKAQARELARQFCPKGVDLLSYEVASVFFNSKTGKWYVQFDPSESSTNGPAFNVTVGDKTGHAAYGEGVCK